MGLYWDYFKERLRLGLICRPGPLALLAEGGAVVLDATREQIISLRDQFHPETCDAEHLVNFARSRGIVQAPLESTEYYHARIKAAYHWWVRGGRASTMAAVMVNAFGAESASVVSLRGEDPARWAEFRLLIRGRAGLVARLDQLIWVANDIKPARSKLANVEITIEEYCTLRHAGIVQIAADITVGMVLARPTVEPSTIYVSGGILIATDLTIT